MPDRFVVPQFIEVEPKVIGSVTVRQFVILLVGALFCFIWYSLFDFTGFLFLSVLTTALFVIIAFVRINGQAFHYFMLNIFLTLKKPSLRVWHKVRIKVEEYKEKGKKKVVAVQLPVKVLLGQGKNLEEIALVVNTGGSYRSEVLRQSGRL